MRFLGMSGAIWGKPELMSYDSQRIRPHLSVSLLYFFDVLHYLLQQRVRMYRLPHQFAPYLSHPDRPRWHHQVAECRAELAELQWQIVAAGVRLTMHLPLSLSFTSPDAAVRQRTLATIEAQALLLTALSGPDSVLVAHLGGVYGCREESIERAVALLETLQPSARALLALEHDEHHWSLNDALIIAQRTQIPIVFDWHHFHASTAPPWNVNEALNAALATWPAERVPKVHLSSPRTEVRIAASQRHLALPTWREHSDLINPFELIRLAQIPALRPFDLMLEAKAGDLALLRARQDLARWLPMWEEQ